MKFLSEQQRKDDWKKRLAKCEQFRQILLKKIENKERKSRAEKLLNNIDKSKKA